MTTTEPATAGAELNWAGNYAFRAGALHRPTSVEQVQEVVASAGRVRALGSRHSFNDIADSPGALVTLAGLPQPVEVAADRRTVTASGAMTYGDLSLELQRQGLGLHAMASLPHISIAGSVATATHGSGDRNGNLATAVAGLELVRGDGEVVRLTRESTPDELAGAVVGLGALGLVTTVTLDVVPTYDVRQDVYEDLPWSSALEHLDEITASAYSVSLFTDWGRQVDQVWLKTLVPAGTRGSAPADVFGARPATRERHPLPELDAENCTPQLGLPGPWLERLPHFRFGFTPSNGDEIQAEFLVPRARAVEGVEAVRSISGVVTPLLIAGELRTVAADDLWLSTAHSSDCVAFHFTFVKDDAAVLRAVAAIEEQILPLGARPHWGKIFTVDAAHLESLYPRMGDFRELVARYDPQGTFRNDYLERTVLTR